MIIDSTRLIKSVQHRTSSTTLFYKVFIWIVPCNQVTTPKPSRFTTLSEQFQPPLAESESASSSKVFVLKARVQIKIQTLWMYQMVNFSGPMMFFITYLSIKQKSALLVFHDLTIQSGKVGQSYTQKESFYRGAIHSKGSVE